MSRPWLWLPSFWILGFEAKAPGLLLALALKQKIAVLGEAGIIEIIGGSSSFEKFAYKESQVKAELGQILTTDPIYGVASLTVV